MILDPHIFDSLAIGQGFFYSKPSEYLAIALYELGRHEAQIVGEIEKLVACKYPNLILYQEYRI